jgi:hypothetical protein
MLSSDIGLKPTTARPGGTIMMEQQDHQRRAIPPKLEARITEFESFFADLQNRSVAAREFPTLIEASKIKIRQLLDCAEEALGCIDPKYAAMVRAELVTHFATWEADLIAMFAQAWSDLEGKPSARQS